jgi:hypothetical protein
MADIEGVPTKDDKLEPRDEDPFEALGYSRPIPKIVPESKPRRSRVAKPGARNPSGQGPLEKRFNPVTDIADQPLAGEARSQQAAINNAGATQAREAAAAGHGREVASRPGRISDTPRVTREVDPEVDPEEEKRAAIERLSERPTLGALKDREQQSRGVPADEVAMAPPDHIED